MASIHRRPASKYWHAFFRDSEGRLVDKSTRLKDRKQAQRVADTLEMAAQRKKSAQHVRAAFAQIFQDTYQETMSIATSRSYADQWLETKKPETARATLHSYSITISAFLDFLGSKADRDLSEVARADLIAFRNSLAGKLSSTSINRYISVLRMLFKTAKRDGYVLENPVEFVELVKNDRNEGRRAFTIPEIKAVLTIADPEWQSLIKFGLYTGQRLGDLASLTWANIDLEHQEIHLTTRKTGKRLRIPLSDALHSHILKLPHSNSQEAPLHPRSFEILERQGRSAFLSNQFTDLLGKAGLRTKRNHQSQGIGLNAKRAESRLSFHSLRHTAVSLLKDAGIPQAAVQELIGHQSASMSQLYTHVGRESLLKAASALPKI